MSECTMLERAVRLANEQLLGIVRDGPSDRSANALAIALQAAGVARDSVFRDSELENALVDGLFDSIGRIGEVVARERADAREN